MATVSNVNLDIQHVVGSNLRTVTVSYRLCFSDCEVLAGTVFEETVKLQGDEPIWDNKLIRIHNVCVKAEKGCIERTVTTRVSRSRLDEDGDTVFLGIPIHADRDEIFRYLGSDEKQIVFHLTPNIMTPNITNINRLADL